MSNAKQTAAAPALLARFELTDSLGNVDELNVYSNGQVLMCGKKTRIPMSLSNAFTGFHPEGYAGQNRIMTAAAREAAAARSAAPIAKLSRHTRVVLVK